MDVACIFLADRNLSEGGCPMKITEDVRKYAAEENISEEQAVQRDLKQKPKEV